MVQITGTDNDVTPSLNVSGRIFSGGKIVSSRFTKIEYEPREIGVLLQKPRRSTGPGIFLVPHDHPQYSLLDICDSFVINYILK